MAIEIERKFLVVGESWRASVTRSHLIKQAYLTRGGRTTVRVRRIGDDRAFLTIKTTGGGVARHEFEYPIPVADAEQLMTEREGAIVAKTRHIVPGDGVTWEIDVFEGDNAGLVVAEVELRHADQSFVRPDWLGPEVSDDRRYGNADLAERPFAQWRDR